MGGGSRWPNHTTTGFQPSIFVDDLLVSGLQEPRGYAQSMVCVRNFTQEAGVLSMLLHVATVLSNTLPSLALSRAGLSDMGARPEAEA